MLELRSRAYTKGTAKGYTGILDLSLGLKLKGRTVRVLAKVSNLDAPI